jgi:hypothetical protein
VDLSAAAFGCDHPASLITRTSACHEPFFLHWNCCSAFDFAQTRDEELLPSRGALQAKFGGCARRIRLTEMAANLYLHPYCTLQNSKPLT